MYNRNYVGFVKVPRSSDICRQMALVADYSRHETAYHFHWQNIQQHTIVSKFYNLDHNITLQWLYY